MKVKKNETKVSYSYRNELARFFRSKKVEISYTWDGFFIGNIHLKLDNQLQYIQISRFYPDKFYINIPFDTPERVFLKYLKYFKNARNAALVHLPFMEIVNFVQSRGFVNTKNKDL